MASRQNISTPSPWQTLDGQGVLRIPTKKTRHHPKVEKPRKNTLKIGTWNAKSLFRAGKSHNIVKEMRRMNLNILGVSEVRWPGTNQINIDEYTMYYVGNNDPQHYNGVAIILDQTSRKSVKKFVPISDRIALIQIKAHPKHINIIQAYAPTAEKPEQEINLFYKDLKNLIKITKKNEVNIVMGDFNAKIGKGRVEDIVGEYGLGERNERGDTLVQFCNEENLMVANTWFQLPDRRLYTWKGPGDNENNIIRNQIDYILIDKRYRNGIKGVRTYPGSDIGSDHNPVVGKIEIRLKKIQREKRARPNFEKLREPETKEKITRILNRKLKETAQLIANESIEESWQSFKNVINEVQENELGTQKQQAKQRWMTEEILLLMEERREYKNKDSSRYKEINKKITRLIKEAKENWMEERCEELEELQNKHDLFNMHKKIREVTGNKNKIHQQGILVTNSNKQTIDPEEIETIWTRYIEELFDDDRTEPDPIRVDQEDQPMAILLSEVKHAIKLLKTSKAPGEDNIYTEMLKLLDDENLRVLTAFLNKIYSSGTLPRNWLQSTFIPIPKKNGANKCSQYRLISLMSHALKVTLRIIHQRIYRRCDQYVGQEQFGFRLGFGTREALFGLNVLMQKCRDQSQDVHLCFIDYEKAFDRVRHTEMINILYEQGVNQSDINIIKNLYWEQTASIRIEDKLTNSIPIKRGVRQGCILSPALFNIYSEKIFQKALENIQEGIKVNGRIVNNIRYADDTVIIANSQQGLQTLINAITREGDAYGLKINTEKTKTMVISKNKNVNTNITIYNKRIEHVNKFRYLGCWITSDLNPETEIRCRIESARSAFLRMKRLLTNPTISLHIRYRFVKAYIYSIVLYGTESWTLKARSMQRLEAFEMWVMRRMLKISWTEHTSNETVLRRMNADREILGIVKRRKTSYLGHIYRGERYEFLRLIMEGKIEGRRGPGRRQCSWLKNVRDWTGLDSQSLLRVAQDRERFAGVVANLL